MITSKIVEIDKDLAEVYLSFERKPEAGVKGANRSASPEVVASFAAAMLRGEWRLTHQGIAFHKDGRLVDGGHRMRALVLATTQGVRHNGKLIAPVENLKIKMLVTEGLTDEDVKAMDIGRRRRGADFLRMDGEINTNLLAATLRLSYCYENVPPSSEGWRKYLLTPDEQAEYLEKNPQIRDSLYEGSTLKKLFTPTAVSAFAFLARKYRPEVNVDEFLFLLRTGLDLSRGNPVYALRELMINSNQVYRRWDTPQQLALLIKAFNRWADKEDVMIMTLRSNEAFPRLASGK